MSRIQPTTEHMSNTPTHQRCLIKMYSADEERKEGDTGYERSFLTINQGNWQPCCVATPGVLISQSASVTPASAPMSSELWVGRGGGGWAGERETETTRRRGRRERMRRSGVLPPLRDTHASRSNSSRVRTEHPSFLLSGKTRLFELLKPHTSWCII